MSRRPVDTLVVDVALINASGDGNVAEELDKARAALERQVNEHFAPVWGIGAKLHIVPADTKKLEPDHWAMILLDLPTVPSGNGAGPKTEGFHDITASGMPVAKAYIGGDRWPERSWTHTASHELLEMLADPGINRVAYDRSDADTARFYAVEVADPVEPLGYRIDGVLVSDFVYPAWFTSVGPRMSLPTGSDLHRPEAEPEAGAGAWVGRWLDGYEPRPPADDELSRPFELARGGYIAFYDTGRCAWRQLRRDASGKLQVFDRDTTVGSRTERRGTPRNRWIATDEIWSG